MLQSTMAIHIHIAYNGELMLALPCICIYACLASLKICHGNKHAYILYINIRGLFGKMRYQWLLEYKILAAKCSSAQQSLLATSAASWLSLSSATSFRF